MKRLLSRSLLVLMVSALIATSINNAYAQRGNRPMRDSARFERGIPNLTAEQKTKIQALRVKHQKEVTPLRNELVEKKAHLHTLNSVEKPDINAINKTIDEISALQTKIMKSNASHRIEVASNLNDEQKVFFNSQRGKMKNGRRGHGMGYGRGNGMGNGNRGNNRPNPNCPIK
ncbi:MAG: periplasmic heavy metal sensor [Bacteroidales bacterium]|nr:MAG: periplasmic heavy metal sensor [Bacteroidales bacterium]